MDKYLNFYAESYQKKQKCPYKRTLTERILKDCLVGVVIYLVRYGVLKLFFSDFSSGERYSVPFKKPAVITLPDVQNAVYLPF